MVKQTNGNAPKKLCLISIWQIKALVIWKALLEGWINLAAILNLIKSKPCLLNMMPTNQADSTINSSLRCWWTLTSMGWWASQISSRPWGQTTGKLPIDPSIFSIFYHLLLLDFDIFWLSYQTKFINNTQPAGEMWKIQESLKYYPAKWSL